jgi:hypothetical protein
MKRLVFVAAGLAALVAVGLAVAKGPGQRSIGAVSGTFTATTVSNSHTRTCTANGKTIVTTKAKYTGTATGDASLTGSITLDVTSTIDTTDDVGTVNGKLRIAGSGKTDAKFSGVYAASSVAGFATGHGRPPMRLAGNVSAGFSAGGGFTNGKIGGGTDGGAAVQLGPGGCAPSH